MSDVKTPKTSPAKEAKSSPKSEKTEGKKASETADKNTDTKTTKASEGKSAAQSSISHFSSVATDEYRAGWANIFGKKKASSKTQKAKASSKTVTDDLPLKLTLFDEDITDDLRAQLYKVFQKKARKDGVRLAQYKKNANIEYQLECKVTRK